MKICKIVTVVGASIKNGSKDTYHYLYLFKSQKYLNIEWKMRKYGKSHLLLFNVSSRTITRLTRGNEGHYIGEKLVLQLYAEVLKNNTCTRMYVYNIHSDVHRRKINSNAAIYTNVFDTSFYNCTLLLCTCLLWQSCIESSNLTHRNSRIYCSYNINSNSASKLSILIAFVFCTWLALAL